MALLVEKPGMPEKAIKPGESIGQFKLVDVTTSEITFAWNFNGELARRSLRELADSTVPASDSRSAPAASAAQPAAKATLGPGALTGFGTKECQPNDSTPDGTVVSGYQKKSITTPFGKSCVWDPVK
jgi:hypothetical protein